MSNKRKIWLWVGMVASVPVRLYAFLCVIFYAWKNAADPINWPSEKVAVYYYSSLAITSVFLGLFIYFLVTLIKNKNTEHFESQKNKK
jgi:uncharacterized membrane protein